MKLSVRPGVRNVKEKLIAQTQKGFLKKHTAQDVKKDNAGAKLNQKAFLKD